MNQKFFGATITKLRKRNRMTQAALAKSLNVSDKAISKWETGLGYPEITLLPRIAAVFGVTIDYLITGERRGITVAGNIVIDNHKKLDGGPDKGGLNYILSMSRVVSGCAVNVAVNLAKLDPSEPISVAGCVGDDENGRYALAQMQRYNVDTGRVKITDRAPTGFSDIMSYASGKQVVFHGRGANAMFSPEDIDIMRLGCGILHIGAVILQLWFERPDPEYGTLFARLLHDVQEIGIRTSVAMILGDIAKSWDKIMPALQYCNFLIINESSCKKIWDIELRDKSGKPNIPGIREVMQRLLDVGVREKVLLHSADISFCLNRDGALTVVPALAVPKEAVKSSVGAGDAFCAGSLFAIDHRYSDKEILEFASGVSANSMIYEDALNSNWTKQDILSVMDRYTRYPILQE